MKNKKIRILIAVLALLPLLAAALLYSRLPAMIPTHWGINGQVDDCSPRSTIWLLAAIGPLVTALMLVLPKIDPRNRNYNKFGGSYTRMILLLAAFFDVVFAVTLIETLRPGSVDIGTMVTVLIGMLFMAMGNMMPKFRQNYFCGVKNPWTYASERVWNKANRLGGQLFFAGGAAMIAAAFLPERWMLAVMIVVILAIVLLPTVMSYVWFRQEKQE